MSMMTQVLAPLPKGRVRRVAFLGTPEMAVPVLRALVGAGVEVVHVITRADKRRARGNDLHPSPVKVAAIELGLNVSHTAHDLIEVHQQNTFDLAVVVAYGALIKVPVLQVVPMLNLHVSLLPRWRGAAPIERALLSGDEQTGVCLMQVEEGLDTGAVLGRSTMAITASTTADDIRSTLMDAGTKLLLDQLRDGLREPVAQQGESTYAKKIEPAELRIDWSDSAEHISRLVRLGGAWSLFRGKRLKIHEAIVVEGASDAPGTVRIDKATAHIATSRGSLDVRVVQPEGKPRMDITSWINGARPTTGEKFSSE
ncbi:MAG: methionyl-tRNA formyltransferase [Actinobacteria bacterium]|nr:methionyl-tRNA formyltransferase [Actinomycetota bacterium]